MLTTKQRKDLFKQKKGNRSAIARAAGVSPQHVKLVLDGDRESPTIEKMIALVLDVPRDEAFPPSKKRASKSGVAA